jgi:hypothetical protein
MMSAYGQIRDPAPVVPGWYAGIPVPRALARGEQPFGARVVMRTYLAETFAWCPTTAAIELNAVWHVAVIVVKGPL